MFNVVLVEPEIPPNTGNVGRLCLATGSRLHLVEPLGFSVDDRQLRRAGMDYWTKISVSYWQNLGEFDQATADASRRFLFTTKVKRPYWEIRFLAGDYLGTSYVETAIQTGTSAAAGGRALLDE